jgi:hypothetical protein
MTTSCCWPEADGGSKAVFSSWEEQQSKSLGYQGSEAYDSG